MKRISEKQKKHLEYMRSRRPEDWRNTKGRPSKEPEVRTYQNEHPESTPWECAKNCRKISYATAKKWWKPKTVDAAEADVGEEVQRLYEDDE